MFIVLKKKTLFFIALSVAIVLGVSVALGVTLTKAPKTAAAWQKVVVIDAGHGGPDRGVVGKSGTEEAAMNLRIAKKLEGLLSDAGVFVVMTRTTDGGASEPIGSFKTEDFAKRKKIIEQADPDLVVSIHCNKFPSSSRRGAQVFFNPLQAGGEAFARSVQDGLNELNETHVGRTYDALAGEYFILNCTTAPSIIVECGFLSNEEDEKLLCDEGYLDAFTLALLGGITDKLS